MTSNPSGVTNQSVEAVLRALRLETGSQGAWQPLLLSAADPATPDALADLAGRSQIRAVFDTIDEQLGELIDTRAPTLTLSRSERAARVEAHLQGVPRHSYGTWVFLPWSGNLVHVLPEDEFRELRTSRNRDKITLEEQERLGRLRLGVVGLSVGGATAVTLAMEGVGGELVLADFDHLSLSNMNRLRAGVDGIGVKKAYLCAREIFEISPYARLTLFPEGITDENMDAFLAGGGRKLDMLFEECDDLFVKVRIRERARALGIPTLMETSDRGLFDVERFDREPNRPLLHGLVRNLNAAGLRGLSTYDKVPTVLCMLGGEKRLSTRSMASMVEIGSTLKTWPQLASGVSLGAALQVDVARRIALDEFHDSGRFYVDLEEIIADGKGYPLAAETDDGGVALETLVDPILPEIQPGAVLTEERARALVAHAVLAPSGGNAQPWRFELRDGHLSCIHDVGRSESFLDYEHRATHLAFGAVAENIELAAAEMNLGVAFAMFPDPARPTLVCNARFFPSVAPYSDRALFSQIAQRATNRRLGPRQSLEPEILHELVEAARERGARLQILTAPSELEAMGRLLGRGDRLRFTSERMHREMMNEIRWNRKEVEGTRDGLDVATFELTPTDLAGMRITSNWRVMELVEKVGGGAALEKPSRKAIASASCVGLISVDGTSPAAFFQTGRAMQRMWLRASALGLAVQPMTAITYLFARLTSGNEHGFSSKELKVLRSLREEYCELLSVGDCETEGFLFRVARTEPPSARALRRCIDDVFVAVKP